MLIDWIYIQMFITYKELTTSKIRWRWRHFRECVYNCKIARGWCGVVCITVWSRLKPLPRPKRDERINSLYALNRAGNESGHVEQKKHTVPSHKGLVGMKREKRGTGDSRRGKERNAGEPERRERQNREGLIWFQWNVCWHWFMARGLQINDWTARLSKPEDFFGGLVFYCALLAGGKVAVN